MPRDHQREGQQGPSCCLPVEGVLAPLPMFQPCPPALSLALLLFCPFCPVSTAASFGVFHMPPTK